MPLREFNPYESPQSPPAPKRRLEADPLALGKVLAVWLGLFIASLCVGIAGLVYALLFVPW